MLIVSKSSCVFGWEERPDQQMCGQWNENFIQWLTNNEVDLVVTPGSRIGETEYILDAAPEWWEKISATGTDLMLVRGMPRNRESIPECLAAGGTPQSCGPPKSPFAETNPLLQLELPDKVHVIDMTPYVCPQFANPEAANCDAVVGNIVAWYDHHHFTTPFSWSLAPAFEAEMEKVIPQLLRPD